MSEAVSALSGAAYDGMVQVRDAGLQGMITVRGDMTSPDMQDAIMQACRLDMPGTLQANVAGERGVLWMSPDEILVLCPYAEAGKIVQSLSNSLRSCHSLVLDVSDARAVFQLRGDRLRDVLAKVTPIDLSPQAFAPGTVRRTRFAQVSAAVWMDDPRSARIVCFRSVAQYMFDLLSTAAQPGGEVDYFEA